MCFNKLFFLVVTSSVRTKITYVNDTKYDYPLYCQELLVFTLVGVVCGFGGALYVFTHRKYVLWMRGNKRLTTFLQKNRFIKLSLQYIASHHVTGSSTPSASPSSSPPSPSQPAPAPSRQGRIFCKKNSIRKIFILSKKLVYFWFKTEYKIFCYLYS